MQSVSVYEFTETDVSLSDVAAGTRYHDDEVPNQAASAGIALLALERQRQNAVARRVERHLGTTAFFGEHGEKFRAPPALFHCSAT